MRYCKLCVQPDTRPNIYFNEEGICGACLWEEEKKAIDWNARLEELKGIASWAKQTKSGVYDCVVGVSGGKDSTFQALFARDTLGLRPLLVCSESYESNALGEQNLKNLKRLGFDTVSIHTNTAVMKKLLRQDFFSCLNPNRAHEYPLHCSAYIIADKFDIPLVIQGENPGQTLGTSQATGAGGNALRIFQHDTIKNNPYTLYKDADIAPEDLFLFYVDTERIAKKVKGVWLSNYVKNWSFKHNAIFSLMKGLKILPADFDPYAISSYRRCNALDHPFRPLNQYLKLVKFGFGGVTDLACYDIRTNDITRDEGIFLVKELDGHIHPNEIAKFCSIIDISEKMFYETIDKFRGEMWTERNNKWQLINPIWEQKKVSLDLNINQILKRFDF